MTAFFVEGGSERVYIPKGRRGVTSVHNNIVSKDTKRNGAPSGFKRAPSGQGYIAVLSVSLTLVMAAKDRGGMGMDFARITRDGGGLSPRVVADLLFSPT